MKNRIFTREIDTSCGKRTVKISATEEKYLELAEKIAAEGMPGDAEIIYKGRNRVYKVSFLGEKLCIKAFHCPRFPNSYIYTNFKKSKPRRSFDNANMLLTAGIGTPEPKAWVECNSRGRLKEGYYISEYVPSENMRQWENKADCAPLLKAFAREMLKIHNAGIYHRDFSPGNALYTGNSENGYKFYFVDLNRMEFGVHDRKKLMRNFRAINLNEKETDRLARIYAEEARLDPDATAKEAVDNLRAYMASKARHRAMKRIFKRKRK